jgi:hypothetical protein
MAVTVSGHGVRPLVLPSGTLQPVLPIDQRLEQKPLLRKLGRGLVLLDLRMLFLCLFDDGLNHEDRDFVMTGHPGRQDAAPDLLLEEVCFPDLTSSKPFDFRISTTLRRGRGRSLAMYDIFRYLHRHVCQGYRHQLVERWLSGIRVPQIFADQICQVFLGLLLCSSLGG